MPTFNRPNELESLSFANKPAATVLYYRKEYLQMLTGVKKDIFGSFSTRLRCQEITIMASYVRPKKTVNLSLCFLLIID